jgi:hypothetical protein
MFMYSVNLCHECIVVESRKKLTTGYALNYAGLSTDEVCLLEMARQVDKLGYFFDKDSESLMIKHPTGD